MTHHDNRGRMQLGNQLMDRRIELVQDLRRIVVASGITHPAVRGVTRVVCISGSDRSGGNNTVDLLCGGGCQGVMIGGVQVSMQDDDKDGARFRVCIRTPEYVRSYPLALGAEPLLFSAVDLSCGCN